MRKFDELKEALATAATAAGIDKYEIYYKAVREVSTDVLKDEISNFSSGMLSGICFRCIKDGRMGYASSELMEPEEMTELVKRAAGNAKHIENDDEGIIYSGKAKYGKKTSTSVKLPGAAMMKETALTLQRSIYAASEYVSDGTRSQVFAFETETYICNSEGLNLYNTAGMSGGFLNAVIKENGEPAAQFEFALGSGSEMLLPISQMAVDKARSKIGAGEVESGKYDVVIDGRQMREFLSAFSSLFSGKSARLGLSLLAGKEGSLVASPCVSITDNPFDPNCPIQTTFDAEGVAVYPKNIIEDGVLKTFLYDLANAKKSGVESTGNASKSSYADTVGIRPYRFGIEPGECELDELFGIVNNGLYITEVKGLHSGADSASGDFSIESAGYLITNGKKGKPVKSFTIAGNFYEMLKAISHVGNKMDYAIPSGYTVYASPAVVVRNISVAGK